MEAAIRKLHFHPHWFECGLLPVDFFAQCVEDYRRGDDRNLEHYRYRAFRDVLSSHNELSDEQLACYVELCRLDEDENMARAALIDLLNWHGLTRKQYDQLIGLPDFSNAVAQKIIRRNRMRAKLVSGAISNEDFAEMLAAPDAAFERELVASPSLSRQQLEMMAENGASHAVRNVAKSRLARRA